MSRHTIFRNLIYLPWSTITRKIVSAPCYCIRNEKVAKYPIKFIKLNNFIRMASQEASTVPAINYEDVKKIKGPNEYLIDVREREEIRETGAIPGALNIPLSEIQLALTQLPPENFLKKYGREKPSPLAYIVFSCRSGKRSDMAAQLAIKLGYKDVSHYGGGWLDWDAKTSEKKDESVNP